MFGKDDEEKSPELAGLDELIRLLDEKIAGKVSQRRKGKEGAVVAVLEGEPKAEDMGQEDGEEEGEEELALAPKEDSSRLEMLKKKLRGA